MFAWSPPQDQSGRPRLGFATRYLPHTPEFSVYSDAVITGEQNAALPETEIKRFKARDELIMAILGDHLQRIEQYKSQAGDNVELRIKKEECRFWGRMCEEGIVDFGFALEAYQYTRGQLQPKAFLDISESGKHGWGNQFDEFHSLSKAQIERPAKIPFTTGGQTAWFSSHLALERHADLRRIAIRMNEPAFPLHVTKTEGTYGVAMQKELALNRQYFEGETGSFDLHIHTPNCSLPECEIATNPSYIAVMEHISQTPRKPVKIEWHSIRRTPHPLLPYKPTFGGQTSAVCLVHQDRVEFIDGWQTWHMAWNPVIAVAWVEAVQYGMHRQDIGSDALSKLRREQLDNCFFRCLPNNSSEWDNKDLDKFYILFNPEKTVDHQLLALPNLHDRQTEQKLINQNYNEHVKAIRLGIPPTEYAKAILNSIHTGNLPKSARRASSPQEPRTSSATRPNQRKVVIQSEESSDEEEGEDHQPRRTTGGKSTWPGQKPHERYIPSRKWADRVTKNNIERAVKKSLIVKLRVPAAGFKEIVHPQVAQPAPEAREGSANYVYISESEPEVEEEKQSYPAQHFDGAESDCTIEADDDENDYSFTLDDSDDERPMAQSQSRSNPSSSKRQRTSMKTSRIPQPSPSKAIPPLENTSTQAEKKSRIIILRYRAGKKLGKTIQPNSSAIPTPIIKHRRKPRPKLSKPTKLSRGKSSSNPSKTSKPTSSGKHSSQNSSTKVKTKNPPMSVLEGHHLFQILKAERDHEIANEEEFKRDDNFWNLMAARLAELELVRNVVRSGHSCRMWWQRDGRVIYGYNEKTGRYEEGLTRTSTQGKKGGKRGGVKRKREELEEDEDEE